MTKTDIKFFKKARRVATISDYPKLHIGCVAVYQGQIVAIGCNTNKTHPAQKYYNQFRTISGQITQPLIPKLHAELNCINQLKHLDINYSKVKLYIYRIRNDQPYGLSRPCPSCMAAIKDLGIRNIYYTTDEGYGYERLGGVA